MNILFILIPVAILLAGAAVAAFSWAVRDGQFEDTTTPALRMLWDDVADNSQPASEDPLERTRAKESLSQGQ